MKSAAREAAIAAGDKRYHGGPCIKCGLTEKFVSNSSCVFCTTRSTANRSSDVARRYRKSERGRKRFKEYKKTLSFKQTQNRHRRKKYRENNQPFLRRNLKNYGLTIESYDEMLQLQNYSCAACGTHKDQFSRRLSVDHCHETGKVRGLLCLPCNTSLGLMKEDIERMQQLIQYVVKRC